MKHRLYFSVAMAAFTLVSHYAAALPASDTVVDERKNVLTNSFNNCVRTKWTNPSDPCAPPAPPAAQPAPAPAPQAYLSKEDRTIYFGFNKSTLDESEKAKLDSLAKVVNASDALKDLSIVGYTDQFGSNDYNLKLSQKRVDSVIEYLKPQVRVGLTPEQRDVRAEGKAPAEPACAKLKKRQEKIDCMKTERRVEIVLNRQFSK